MSVHMSGVTAPVGSLNATPSTSFSYAQIERRVSSPKYPSTGPGQNPRSVRRCWTSATSSPAMPFDSVRASTVLVIGVLVSTVAITSTDTGTELSSATDSAVTVGAASSPPPPPPSAAPATTTMASRPPAAAAGIHFRASGERRGRSFTDQSAVSGGPTGGGCAHATNVVDAGGRGPTECSRLFGSGCSVAAGGVQRRSITGSMFSRSPRNSHISLRIVVITDGELSVDTPRVRGK